MTSENKESASVQSLFWYNRDASLSIPIAYVPYPTEPVEPIKNSLNSKEVILDNNLDNSSLIDYVLYNNIDIKNINYIEKKEIENYNKNNYINKEIINNFIEIKNILHIHQKKKKPVRFNMKKYAKFINNYIKESKSKYPHFNKISKHNIIRIKNYLHNIIGLWFREREIIQFINEYKLL